ncbi:hypothetical protein [Qipengyuania sphaerica]|uniref:hypothetical protein n=1 Tax=Qipengyuania sphaerica TaxID=2867243 RepID=UPI001C868E9D|nr:hypothetical protein [Qipengyuania sphaerica]MBX7540724.1 hypothetical protein [Qipengyuania sphaerica]
MIRFALPIAALAASAAFAQTVEQDNPSDHPPAAKVPEQAERNCEDSIREVREASGQPQLDRGTSDGSDALFIAAVDQRIDGCAVMVMRQDTNDIRPLPQPSDDVRVILIK